MACQVCTLRLCRTYTVNLEPSISCGDRQLPPGFVSLMVKHFPCRLPLSPLCLLSIHMAGDLAEDAGDGCQRACSRTNVHGDRRDLPDRVLWRRGGRTVVPAHGPSTASATSPRPRSLSLCLCLCLSVSVSACLSTSLSLPLSLSVSVCLSLSLPAATVALWRQHANVPLATHYLLQRYPNQRHGACTHICVVLWPPPGCFALRQQSLTGGRVDGRVRALSPAGSPASWLSYLL